MASAPDMALSSSSLMVTPPSANVLTCDSLQLKEIGGVGNGTWSVSPTGAGSVSATGDYSAPTMAPMTPAVTVGYSEGTRSASAALQVATAFVGTPAALAIAGDNNLGPWPFEHQFAASGSSVYAAIQSADTNNAEVFASADNGRTFGAPTTYHKGNSGCATVAADAGNPQVVYLVYQAGHGDSTGNTGGTVRLAVSTDGAKTFPVEYVIADSTNGIANMICPDVVSPSPGHVLVLGVVGDATAEQPVHVGAFVSGNSGAGIGPVGTPLTCSQCPMDGSVFYATTDTNASTNQSLAIAADGNGISPTAGTNGKGDVCMVFDYITGNSSPNLKMEVQCSQDSGKTWTTPVGLGTPPVSGDLRPTVAVSPGGTVAVAWIQTANNADNAFIALSSDGGKSFGAPIQYPALGVANFGTADPVVAWESDQVLWLSQTFNVGNTSTIFADKTCDGGKTWSGAVQVAALHGTSLAMTNAGMVVAGYDTQTPSLEVLALDAP